MKKNAYLIILAILVSVLLVACSGKNETASNDQDFSASQPDNSSHTPDGSQPENPGNGDNTPGVPTVDCSNISKTADFTNGLAFIQYEGDDMVYCIDKTGKIVFTLSEGRRLYDAQFNGKLAMVNMIEAGGTKKKFLCDKQGKMYYAEDLGASQIVINNDNHKKAFMDGYIILEQREESYTGTVVKMSIMDSEFNTLVPFSVELAEILNDYTMNVNGTAYYDGYLYFEDTILNLRTGMLLTDRAQMQVSAPLLGYRSHGSYGGAFEHLEWGDIYNTITGEVIAKAEESEAISSIKFVNNMGLATYFTDNGDWFNIIGADGAAKFQPIKKRSRDSRILFDGNVILVYGSHVVEKDGQIVQMYTLQTYDISGNLLGEMNSEEWKQSDTYIELSDGVIRASNHKTNETLFLNAALEKLF